MSDRLHDVTKATADTRVEVLTDGALSEAVKASTAAIAKAEGFTTDTGLVAIDLEPGAKHLYPRPTPLRNRLARIGGGTGMKSQWRSLTSINEDAYIGGVEQGKRNEFAAVTEKDYDASYGTLQVDDFVSFEAEEAGKGFADVRAESGIATLQRLMRVEERVLLGGNRSLALGQVANVTLSDNTDDGGSINQTTTVNVFVVALTLQGYKAAGFVGLAVVASTIPVTRSRSNSDGTTTTVKGYMGTLSSIATVTTATDANNAHTISVSWDAIPGAVAYAVFWGPTNAAASALGFITTINSYKITTAVGVSTAMYADATGITSDNSKNALEFDGVIALMAGAGQGSSAGTPDTASGAIIKTMGTGTPGTGTTLHTASDGGIVEFDDVMRDIYLQSGVGVDEIWVSPRDIATISKVVIGGGGAPLFRFTSDQQGTGPNKGVISAGVVVGSYLSKYGWDGEKGIPITPHYDLPSGTVLFMTYKLPYPISGIENVWDVRTRREYYELIWALKTTRYEHSVRVSEVARLRAGLTNGMICNMAPAGS
jgi:hypothetical protein